MHEAREFDERPPRGAGDSLSIPTPSSPVMADAPGPARRYGACDRTPATEAGRRPSPAVDFPRPLPEDFAPRADASRAGASFGGRVRPAARA